MADVFGLLVNVKETTSTYVHTCVYKQCFHWHGFVCWSFVQVCCIEHTTQMSIDTAINVRMLHPFASLVGYAGNTHPSHIVELGVKNMAAKWDTPWDYKLWDHHYIVLANHIDNTNTLHFLILLITSRMHSVVYKKPCWKLSVHPIRVWIANTRKDQK